MFPNDHDRAQASTARIDALIGRMDVLKAELVADDDRCRIFHATYNRITHAVRAEIASDGFIDNDWVQSWDVAFAGFYLDALDTWRGKGDPSRPWQVAFEASLTRLAPLRHVLLGMNAHINYDLPQALVAVIPDADFRDEQVMARRHADHQRIDAVLSAQVAAEDELLRPEEMPGDRTWVDTALKPLNRLGTKRFLREARAKVWRNTHVLAAARQEGDTAYMRALGALEMVSAEKVTQLLEPGHVLLKLARHGFGVVLPS
ncbi:MAG: hypothetical protein IPG68_05965 [Micrococcales bacterium]|nr:hypothetical protein [Micrococcales bacterium]